MSKFVLFIGSMVCSFFAYKFKNPDAISAGLVLMWIGLSILAKEVCDDTTR